jgi:tetratricopeptide (TPR) repeat protein
MSKKDASHQPNAETITPLNVSLKNRGIETETLKRRHRIGIIALVCALAAVIAVGVYFLRYLSQNPLQPQQVKNDPPPGQPEPTPATVSKPETPAPPPIDPAKLDRDRQMAEQKLAEYLETRGELDGKGAAEWGGDVYRELVDIGRQADSLLIKEEYQPASAAYTRATDLGRQLAESSATVLLQLLKEGQLALADGNGAVAGSRFKVAMLIDPANRSAQKGLKRSRTIETVHQLIESGKALERDGALSGARDNYQEALQIDPESGEARQALARVGKRLKEQQFNQLMSAGLTAFHNNDFSQARSSLLKAKALKPDSREAADALLQVDEALRLARINRLRDAAQQAEKSEDWQAALKSYLAVLEIDRNVQFAVRGKESAEEQIRVAKRLDYYINRPKALESDRQLENAVLLINEARETEPRGRKLTGRINELEKLVALARTPVTITIESDNLTQIAVYRVGKLGRFSEHRLKVRPGTYTVVGTRDGYKDVRQKIVVEPGQQALRVTVICRVEI